MTITFLNQEYTVGYVHHISDYDPQHDELNTWIEIGYEPVGPKEVTQTLTVCLTHDQYNFNRHLYNPTNVPMSEFTQQDSG